MRLWYCHFTCISNAEIIQVTKLVNSIKLLDTATNSSNDNWFSLNSKADNKKRSEKVDGREENKPDIDMHFFSAVLNKIMESIKNLCDTYIKSEYTKIVKYKAMIPIIQKLKKIYADL